MIIKERHHRQKNENGRFELSFTVSRLMRKDKHYAFECDIEDPFYDSIGYGKWFIKGSNLKDKASARQMYIIYDLIYEIKKDIAFYNNSGE